MDHPAVPVRNKASRPCPILDMARKIARKMDHEWGMGEKLYYEPEQQDAEAEINRLLETADRQAHEISLAEREKTEKLAKALLVRETLTREEVLEVVNATVQEPALATA